MAAHSRPPLTMTLAQYLAFEESAASKHEYVEGEVHAMSGGTYAHSVLQSNLVRALGNALVGRACVAHGPDMRVAITTSAAGQPREERLYPDVSVVCGQPELTDHSCAVRNPTLICEVLSPSSEHYDRSQKFVLYRAIPTFREYLLISQSERKVEQYTRNDDGTWTIRTLGEGASIALPSIGVRLSLDELYEHAFDGGGAGAPT